ncbi:MAG TPA: glycoside hydrolase domain-containing protein, partial [Puia sp.]
IPAFDKITITLDHKYYTGDTIGIVWRRKKDAPHRISSIQWNGQKHTKYSITHRDLVRGGLLTIITQ